MSRHPKEIDYKQYCNIEELITNFKRPHDSFGGKRRARAFFILGATTAFFDLPDILELARQTLKAKRSRSEASGATEFIELYYRNNNDERVNDELEVDL